jgi:phosphoserine phosphatase RsbU/P
MGPFDKFPGGQIPIPRRIACRIGLVLALIFGARLCRAQEILLPNADGPVAVNGPWQISYSDSPGTGNAAVQASTWHPIGVYSPANYPPGPEILWFRATLKMSQPPPSPALLIAPTAVGGCQIFINGTEAANCAELSAPNDAVQRGILVHLPATSAGAPIAIAIRLFHPAYVRTGGFKLGTGQMPSGFHLNANVVGLGPGDILFGSARTLADYRTARDAANFYDLLPQALLCLAELIGGAILLVLFAFDRQKREYAWFAVFLWLDGSCSLLSVFQRVYPVVSPLAHYATDLIGLIARYAPLIGFLAAFTGVRTNRWVRAYQIILVVVPFVIVAEFKGIELGYWHLWQGTSYAVLVAQLPFVFGSLLFLALEWRRGNKEAALLLPSFLLANGIEILGLLSPYFQRHFHLARFGFDFDDISMFFFLISIGPIMLLRHRRIGLDHARATAELDAAREIQQRLVPAKLPAIPGYTLGVAYLPAAEVGGDFYQVFEQNDGSTLVVVGDVSGKGLKAAMKGTLLLGALRALASEGLSPAVLLTRLNRDLFQSHDGGFITCLGVRINRDGAATLSNAGHLSPYLNGDELALESALPLGLAVDAAYSESTIQLKAGDRLTFMSDGIVEARNHAGDLFGFERTRAISLESAGSIAEAAQRFGQEDDITVMTLAVEPLRT